MNTWETDQAARVGAAVKKLRGKRTGQWLADRTEELGMQMTRQTVTDLENGRRRYVTTAELIVLAAALNTAPITLLYPGPDYTNSIHVLPNHEASEFDAAQWFSGMRNAGFTESDFHSRQEYRATLDRLSLRRELWSIDKRIMRRDWAGVTEMDDLLGRRQEIESQLGVERDNDGR